MDYDEYVKLLKSLQKNETSLFSHLPDYVLAKICNKLLHSIHKYGYRIMKQIESSDKSSDESSDESIYTFELSKDHKYCQIVHVYLGFKLPAIDLSDGTLVGWTKNIGCALIDNCTITIDGVEESYDGSALLYEISISSSKALAIHCNHLIGNVIELQHLKNKHDPYAIYIPIMINKKKPIAYKHITCKIRLKPAYTCMNYNDLTDGLKMVKLSGVSLSVDYLYCKIMEKYNFIID